MISSHYESSHYTAANFFRSQVTESPISLRKPCTNERRVLGSRDQLSTNTAHLNVVPGGVLVTRGLGLPGLDDGEGVAAELLEQPGGDAARALLNMETL